MGQEFSNQDDVIDSRDVIDRIDELESELQSVYDDFIEGMEEGDEPDFDDWVVLTAEEGPEEFQEQAQEFLALKKLEDEASDSPDWRHGEQLIRDSYFEEYAQQLHEDTADRDMIKALNSSDWPYRHMSIDWEAAADELKSDYISVDFDGVEYWIRG